ncbi:MAG: substrate-binding domain-containing protein [Flexilinea sp.]
MKKLVVVLLALAVLMSFVPAFAEGELVGVAMPTNSLQRWNQDGENMKAQLEAAGYKVDLQYANNDVAMQISQLENMILNECKVLVIASIDGGALGDILKSAADNGIKVIAYDRLIKGADYYTSFDNYRVGKFQGDFIVKALDLENAAGPFNIEYFGGSPDDNNAHLFNQGAMDVLQPYIDSGKLVNPSGQIDFETVAILGWGTEDAQARMDNLIAGNYADGTPLDVVLSPNDSLALGIANSLTAAGFTAENWPIITGQDCDIPNTINIIKGLQSMSVFKDTRTLAARTVTMVGEILSGAEVEVNDTESYGVPSFLCDPVFADINNYKELLIDSGYYTADQLTVK